MKSLLRNVHIGISKVNNIPPLLQGGAVPLKLWKYQGQIAGLTRVMSINGMSGIMGYGKQINEVLLGKDPCF
jgi:hypothetical protein